MRKHTVFPHQNWKVEIPMGFLSFKRMMTTTKGRFHQNWNNQETPFLDFLNWMRKHKVFPPSKLEGRNPIGISILQT